MTTGEKIKKLRIERGMTLEQLGNRVGVGKSTVRKWEQGIIANMKRDKISSLANALRTTPAYLLGWEETEIHTIANDDFMLIELFNRLDPTDRKALIKYAEFLLDEKKK